MACDAGFDFQADVTKRVYGYCSANGDAGNEFILTGADGCHGNYLSRNSKTVDEYIFFSRILSFSESLCFMSNLPLIFGSCKLKMNQETPRPCKFMHVVSNHDIVLRFCI